MARIIYSSLGDSMQSGPFPNKTGEFCGNVLQKTLILAKDGVTVSNTRYRIGKPGDSDSPALEKTKTLTKLGYVGLYLTEDIPLREDEVEIITDIFTEEVVSGGCLPEKPIDFSKIRRKGL